MPPRYLASLLGTSPFGFLLLPTSLQLLSESDPPGLPRSRIQASSWIPWHLHQQSPVGEGVSSPTSELEEPSG